MRRNKKCLRGLAAAATVPAVTPVLIKKYGNRRLYDTETSRYLTLDDLAAKVRAGSDVRVVDDKSGDDLTQATLTQLILESKDAARMLPVPLLMQLVRMGDDALAEFFGRHVAGALDAYLQARRGAQSLASMAPFGGLPLAASDALGRLFMASPFAQGFAAPYGYGAPVSPPAAAAPPPAPPADAAAAPRETDVAALRRELDELKKAVSGAIRKRRR